MEKDRVILHCDMNSFFCSVELLDHPELKDKPCAVGGDENSRHGIILAKNTLAKKMGVVTPEPIWQAKKKCPNLVVLSPHHEKYHEYYKLINKIYQRYTDLVEPFSIDESWLDVTNSKSLFGDGVTIGNEIRETVKRELGLTLSCGVSFNKIFAKMGSDYKKPDATTEITRENYQSLLFPLPAEDMFFCGKKTANKLKTIGINTIGDIANADKKMLEDFLGSNGIMLWNYVNGLDESPVNPIGYYEKPKSLGHGITFSKNLTTFHDIEKEVTYIADIVSSDLRKEGMKGNAIKVDIKDPYFKVISRQKKLFSPTNLQSEIKKMALEIINENWEIGKPIRLITITAINLEDEDESLQLNLFSNDNEAHLKDEKMERSLDDVRKKFGNSIITFGIEDKND